MSLPSREDKVGNEVEVMVRYLEERSGKTGVCPTHFKPGAGACACAMVVDCVHQIWRGEFNHLVTTLKDSGHGMAGSEEIWGICLACPVEY